MQPYDKNLYLSSVICAGTIYLQPFNNALVTQYQPYFLRQYAVTVDRESVFKNKALIKVDAISMNPNNLMPINLQILSNEYSDLFIMDSTQGYIYPRYNLGLTPKTYIIKVYENLNSFKMNIFIKIIFKKVQATDPTNQQYSLTDVYITITFKTDNKLICDSTYLNIKANPTGVILARSHLWKRVFKLFCFVLRGAKYGGSNTGPGELLFKLVVQRHVHLL